MVTALVTHLPFFLLLMLMRVSLVDSQTMQEQDVKAQLPLVHALMVLGIVGGAFVDRLAQWWGDVDRLLPWLLYLTYIYPPPPPSPNVCVSIIDSLPIVEQGVHLLAHSPSHTPHPLSPPPRPETSSGAVGRGGGWGRGWGAHCCPAASVDRVVEGRGNGCSPRYS